MNRDRKPRRTPRSRTRPTAASRQQRVGSGRRRWLRRLTIAAVVVGVAIAVIVVVSGLPTPAGRQARDGLRDSSVFVHPTATALLDAPVARRLIGDRPLVVAVRPGGNSGSASRACEDIVAEYTDVVAFVYGRWDRWESCAGDSFPEPADTGMLTWLWDLEEHAEAASLLGPVSPGPPAGDDTDLDTFVAELVAAFDAGVADLSSVPGRRATSDVWDWVSVSLLVLPGAVVAVAAFLALRHLGGAVTRRRRRRQELAGSLAEVRAMTYRLASRLTAALPEASTTTTAIATAARDYAYAVAMLETAASAADLARVRERLAFADEALGDAR